MKHRCVRQAFFIFVLFYSNASFVMAGPEYRVFLDIGPGAIPGNAITTGFKNQIVVQDFSFGVSQASPWEEGGQSTTRLPRIIEFTFSKLMDQASPRLAEASAKKTQYDKAVLTVVDPTGLSLMKVTLEDIIITSVGVGIKPGDARPKEVGTLSYLKSTWNVGTKSTGFDFAANSSALTAPQPSSALTAPTESSALLDSTTETTSKRKKNRKRRKRKQ